MTDDLLSLCQVCDGPVMSGAPLPLCVECIKTAFRFGLDCLPVEYELFTRHPCPFCNMRSLLLDRLGRHIVCAVRMGGCGRVLPADVRQWPAADSEEHAEAVAEEMSRRAKEKYDTELAGLTEGSWVYYIRVGDQIKIGVSVRPVERAKALSLTAEHIVGLERGAHIIERQRHKQFAHLRRHGEWFTAAPDLLAHIQSLEAVAV